MGLLANNEKVPYMSLKDYELFRTRLARKAEIDLDEMAGFGGDKPWDQVDDDIKLFLNHPEYDCTLTPSDCQAILPRLISLVSDWFTKDPDRRKAEKFAAALADSVANEQSLSFHMRWRESGEIPFMPLNVDPEDQLI